MIPHTVPNSPMKGDELPTVARNGTRRSSDASCTDVSRRIARPTTSTVDIFPLIASAFFSWTFFISV